MKTYSKLIVTLVAAFYSMNQANSAAKYVELPKTDILKAMIDIMPSYNFIGEEAQLDCMFISNEWTPDNSIDGGCQLTVGSETVEINVSHELIDALHKIQEPTGSGYVIKLKLIASNFCGIESCESDVFAVIE